MKSYRNFASILVLVIFTLSAGQPAAHAAAANQGVWSISGFLKDPHGHSAFNPSTTNIIVKVKDTEVASGTCKTDGSFEFKNVPYGGPPSATNYYSISAMAKASNGAGLSGVLTLSPSAGASLAVTLYLH